MMAPVGGGDAFAAETLANLESRLHNLEFLLTGSADDFGLATPASNPSTREETVTAKIVKLGKQLRKLKEQSRLVQEVLVLQQRYPNLFAPASQAETQIPSSLDPETTAAIVLAHASAFSETASRLTSLKDLDTAAPPAAKSAILVDLQPRIDIMMEVQDRQRDEISELRARSARVVERWMGLQVETGEFWSELEEKAGLVERAVGRLEAERRREEAV